MAIKQFRFTKDWRSPTDFPTYEGNEAKVREDMQFPLDELKKYINGEIVPSVENSVHSKTFAHMRIYDGILQVSKDEIVWTNVGVANSGGGGGGDSDCTCTNGKDGVGISKIAYLDVDDKGGNVYGVTLTDGSAYRFTAPKGNDGAPGRTPVAGVDYWTETEKKLITREVVETVTDGAGEDGLTLAGGYYTPSVSSDGTLTWTPSKSNMPGAPSVSIKGPKGEPGHTPVKGTDYFTADDVQAIINEVLKHGGSTYELPYASATTLGGIKIGNGLIIDENGVVSVDASIMDLPNGDGVSY